MAILKPFRVGYLERPIDPAFLSVVNGEPAVALISVPLALTEDRIAEKLARCHAYYVGGTRGELPLPWHVTRDFLARFPGIMVVIAQGAGFDTVDVPACTEAGIPVINQAGGNASGVAEHAIGMILTLLKRIPEAQGALRAGTVRSRNALMGRELGSVTLGLVGLGHTGSRTAQLATAFGCRTCAFDPYLDAATIARRGAEKVGFAQLLADSDIISLHCPRNSETMGMFGAEQFGRMRSGAIFISTARGGIHDEAALYESLVSGHLAGAGLDVWDPEPPSPDHPLLSLPNVVASPHLAGVTRESRANVGRMGGEAIVAACRGGPLPRVVNPETKDAFEKRWQSLAVDNAPLLPNLRPK